MTREISRSKCLPGFETRSGHLTEAEAAAGVAAALPAEEGAREAAAAEALRELLARLAAGWAGKSNKWASEPIFERRVASVRAAFRKV